MKAQDLVNFMEEKENQTLEEAMSNTNGKTLKQIMRYFDDRSEAAKALILEKMSEKHFVQIVDLVDSMVVAGMTMNNQGTLLALAKMKGDGFQAFTHTLVLTVLGILIDEEVV